jgi:predicted nucleic acid-binding protein
VSRPRPVLLDTSFLIDLERVHLAQARRCALVQRRARHRMGENDAWLVATAESIDADIVGADRISFERLGARYLRYR